MGSVSVLLIPFMFFLLVVASKECSPRCAQDYLESNEVDERWCWKWVQKPLRERLWLWSYHPSA